MSEEAKSQQEPSMEEILASIRRIISEDDTDEAKSDDAKSDDAAVEDGVEENDDVLELTDVVEDEEPVQEIKPAEEEAPQSQDDIDTLFDEADLSDTDDEIELVEEEEKPATDVIQEVFSEPAAKPVAAVAPEGSLLDAAPATAATGSLSGLVAAVDAAHGTPIGNGNRTIEDLVKEVMRPMIKEWLDDNLPALVDRVVRREVERLSRTAEGDE